MRTFWYLLVVLVISGGQAGVTGKISGKIFDKNSKEPLAGVNVTLAGTSVGAASDVDGYFVILNLPPGGYVLKTSYIGYETVTVENVTVISDQNTVLAVEMAETRLTLDDQITVIAERPLIQKDLTGTISVVDREKIESLPVTKFTDILALQAGVVGSGSSLHIRGGRSNEVAYLIDGMFVNDPLLGGLATEINNDAIQEMSLLSGTFNAEYGNALSGVVNIVTREGGTRHEGKVEVRVNEMGSNGGDELFNLADGRINTYLSGPLMNKNIRYFLSGEIDKYKSYLPFGYDDNYIAFGKLSFLFSSIKLNLTNRASIGKRQNYNHSYKYIPDQYLHRDTDSWQSGLILTHSLSNKIFYELRISYFNQGYYSGVGKDTSQYIKSSEVQFFDNYGNGVEFYSLADPLQLTRSRTATFDAKADMVMQVNSRNEVKFGFQYKKHWLNLFDIYDPKRDHPYINIYKTRPFEASSYLQDKIEFPYLIINLGLRFDYMNSNVRFRKNPLNDQTLITVKPRAQLSPRIGIAHPISERTKLHFSYGHFFQNPEYQFLFENQQYDMSVREPIFGQPSLDAERTIAYEVGIHHQFSENILVSLTAYYKDVKGLIGTHYYEFRSGYTSQYTAYTLYVNEDYANIKGFEVNMDIRPIKGFSAGLTYTYSVAKGSASSETEQYPGTTESTRLYFLDFDRTHVLNASASYKMGAGQGPNLFNFKILANTDYNFIFRASSGYPYTPSGRDIGFVERNSLRSPSIYTIDAEIGKKILLTPNLNVRLFVEILNITNHRNILYVYPDTGDPDFTIVGGHSREYMRDPSNYGPPRKIRVGLGFAF